MSGPGRKDVKDVIRYAGLRGFELTGRTGTGHWRMVHLSGQAIILPASPSCSRWDKNAKAKINRINRAYSEDS